MGIEAVYTLPPTLAIIMIDINGMKRGTIGGTT